MIIDDNGITVEIAEENEKGMVQVTEQEYMRNEQQRLDAFADLIRNCGITLYELSKGTRIKYDTLLRAQRGLSIHAANEARIRLYIQIKQNGNNEN